MEILKILEESGGSLYPEDLDFFETELATGGPYDTKYRRQCNKKIKELRAWQRGDTPGKSTTDQQERTVKTPQKLVVGIGDLAPKEANPAGAAITPEQAIRHDIANLRNAEGYKSAFKKYVADREEIDSDFVDANYSIFEPWELDAIISVKQMTEAFLEKYFGALDHNKIARYQRFSEGFFMKHFSQLDAEIVLKYGKNEWRKKQNRSKQLDVFLRLKGVKL